MGYLLFVREVKMAGKVASIVVRLVKIKIKSGTESRIHEYKCWCRSGLLQGLFESFITKA